MNAFAQPRSHGVIQAPAQQLSRVFPVQSFCDPALQHRALRAQAASSPIVQDTAREEQLSGYAVGLSPSSQTPVAIRFNLGDHSSAGAVVILKPGQIMVPTGGEKGGFSSFTWGLPFGWLGGGLATLHVFRTPTADVAWPGNPEVMFHQVTVPIVTPSTIPALPTPNWPTRFPWVAAQSGANGVEQGGKPMLSVEPTRIILRLRFARLEAEAVLRILIRGENYLDIGSDGISVSNANRMGVDISLLGDSTTGTSWPVVEIAGGPLCRTGSDLGGIDVVDGSGNLTGQFVDIQRWGRL